MVVTIQKQKQHAVIYKFWGRDNYRKSRWKGEREKTP
jgi:hypothetical protein